MKRIKLSILAFFAVGSLATVAVAPQASAFNPFGACKGDSSSQVCKASSSNNMGALVSNITSVLLWAIGAVSVIMIVIGGFKYVTSNGDSNSIQSAKNTILYSAIGLAVAILGQGIVIFVVNWLS